MAPKCIYIHILKVFQSEIITELTEIFTAVGRKLGQFWYLRALLLRASGSADIH